VARVLLPNRVQLELRACDLESLLPEEPLAKLCGRRRRQMGMLRIAGL